MTDDAIVEQTQDTPDAASEPPKRPGWSDNARAATAGAALYLAYFTIITLFNALNLPLHPFALVGIALLSSVGYLLVLVYAIYLICRLELRGRAEMGLLLLTLALFLALNPLVHEAIGAILSGEDWSTALASLRAPASDGPVQIVVPFLLIMVGVFFGQIVAKLIRERAILVPVALIAGIIDFWGVYWGPVSVMSASAPTAVAGLATASTTAAVVPDAVRQQLPQALSFIANIQPPQNIGIGDFVFLAFFLTCAYRLGLSARRTMWGIFIGLVAASCIIALNGMTLLGHTIAIEYLPGLVFICGGVLCAHLREWHLSRREWAMTGALVGLLAVLIGISIVRVEMNRLPEIAGYQQPAASARQLYTESLARIAHMNTQDTLACYPVQATFVYLMREGQARLYHWQIDVYRRDTGLFRRDGMLIRLLGVRASEAPDSGWLVSGEAQAYTDPDAGPRDAIRLPETAAAMLDRVPGFAPTDPAAKGFLLILRPEEAIVTYGKDQVRHIPYTHP